MTAHACPTFTTEQLFGDSLLVRQPSRGYRFTVDSVILAHFVTPSSKSRIVDLGSGSGIIPLVLAYRHPDTQIAGVEIQKNLAALARENIDLNRLAHRVTMIHGDMKDRGIREKLGRASLVVSNPPYTPLSSGRINPDPEKAVARHEIAITLKALVETASALLVPLGKFSVIVPCGRLSELLETLQGESFSPARIRFVHPLKQEPAKRVLVESVKGGQGGAEECPPLFIYEKHGGYSGDMEEMFRA